MLPCDSNYPRPLWSSNEALQLIELPRPISQTQQLTIRWRILQSTDDNDKSLAIACDPSSFLFLPLKHSRVSFPFLEKPYAIIQAIMPRNLSS